VAFEERLEGGVARDEGGALSGRKSQLEGVARREAHEGDHGVAAGGGNLFGRLLSGARGGRRGEQRRQPGELITEGLNGAGGILGGSANGQKDSRREQ
jgi:hypothetical protein